MATPTATSTLGVRDEGSAVRSSGASRLQSIIVRGIGSRNSHERRAEIGSVRLP